MLADAYPAQRFAATVQSIAPLVDAQRGAVEVKLALPQAPPAFLREDMTLSIEVETGRRERALVLPASALLGAPVNGQARVHVLQDGRVVARQVRLGLQTLDGAEVLDGLSAGDVLLLGASPAPGQRARADTGASAAAEARAGGEAGAALSGAMGR